MADPAAAGGRTVLVVAFPDLNPLTWLAGQAVGVAADAWKSAMVGLWSAGLWLLQLAFKVIDAFTVPDLTANGPLAGALPTTLWLGLTVAGLMMSVQLAVAVVRRDGQGLGRILLGIGQFGAVWVCYLAVAGLLTVAAGALTHAILGALLHVGGWAQYSVGDSWPRSIDDAVAASVLGLSSLFLLIPASFAYLMIMLVREAALVILLATAPISAGGLLNDTTKVWFWKTLRWFIASLLIAPAAALILGIGVQLSNGAVQGAGTDTVAACGAAVVGCILVMIGAVCPMVLFKLLAFVEPGTASGAALRQSMSDAGGVGGLLSGGGRTGGSGQGAAAQGDGAGRSQGEAAAETATSSRMSGMLGPLGAGISLASKVATKAADLTADVLGSAGVGDPGYSAGFADNAASNRRPASQNGGQRGGQRGGQDSGGHDSGGQDSGGGPAAGGPPPTDGGGASDPAGPAGSPVSPPVTGPPGGPAGGGPGAGGTPGHGAAGGGAGGAGGAGAAGGGTGVEVAAVVL